MNGSQFTRIDVGALLSYEEVALQIAGQVDVGEITVGGDPLTPIDLAHFEGTLSRVRRGITFEGRVRARYSAQCARCTEPTTIEIDADVQQMYIPMHEVDDQAEEEGTLPISEETIDLTGALREAVVLSAPMRALCSDACRGLCPQCGIDLNTELCSCSSDVGDVRWQALRELKDQLEQE